MTSMGGGVCLAARFAGRTTSRENPRWRHCEQTVRLSKPQRSVHRKTAQTTTAFYFQNTTAALRSTKDAKVAAARAPPGQGLEPP